MLIWKRLMPPKVRALLALGTLTALVAVATLKPLPHVWGQDKEAPTRKVEKQAEEKAEEQTEKKTEEPAPVKEAEVKQEGRGEKTEKEPAKGEEKTPEKTEGKEPMKEEGRGPRKTEGKEPMQEEGDAPRKVEGKGPMKEEGKTPEGRPVRRKGDPEISKDPVPGRGRPEPRKEMKEPGEGKRPVPGKEDPQGGPIVGFNGGISFDAKNTSKCGKGQICYNYALPTVKTPAGIITGTLEITLKIYQHGSTTPLVFTPPTLMQSGVLADGDHYCFDVDPTTFPGIDLAAGGFDFVASAKFSLNGSDSTFLVGSVPQGVVLNKNNDYRIECESSTGTKGEIVYDARSSTTCGKGQICFNLKLPTMKDPKGNVITATGEIHLTLFQDGQAVLSLPSSPVLNDKTGTRYCFSIDPANMKGLNCDLGGFDFVATAMFDFGEASTASSKGICGIAPNGIIEGVNNDYQCECPPGGGTKGEIVYDERTSTTCGRGKICFYLKMPTVMDLEGNTYTSTGVINVTIFQNGVAVLSLPASPVLSDKTGTKYCFPIDPPDPTNPADPTNLPNLNPNLGGFDFVATATFTFGGMAGIPPTSATVGSAPVGIIAEVNNDYQIVCDEIPVEPKECGCCPGKELVVNGDFEQGTEIKSEYEWTSEYDKLFPGTYSVGHVDKIGKFCKNWVLPRECRETKDFSENVLIVNGQTNQPAGSTAVIWSQQIVLPSGEKEADYHLCFRYLPLPQCCFDIQAKPYVLVNGGKIPLTDPCDEDNGCGRIYAATFHGAGTVNVQIVLPGDGKGDGSDLLIDNISMVKIEKLPLALVQFSLDADPTPGDPSTFDIVLTAPTALLTSGNTWAWEVWDGTNTTILYGPFGPNLPTYTITVPIETEFTFKLKAWSSCHLRTGWKEPWGSGEDNSRKARMKASEDTNPAPVDTKAFKTPKVPMPAPAAKKRAE